MVAVFVIVVIGFLYYNGNYVLSHYHIISLSHYLIIKLSHYLIIKLSHYQIITLNLLAMDICIVGTGNVATVLGLRIMQAGHTIIQVYGRNLEQVAQLGKLLNCPHTTNVHEITNQAAIYIIAVSDAAIADVATSIGTKKGLVLHTAGSVSSQVLANLFVNYGVLYPLQSISKHKTMYSELPLLVHANTPDNKCLLTNFALTISDSVAQVTDNERLKMHLAAVLVNNFTNHIYSVAASYCQSEQLNFKMLLPIIIETATRLHQYDPRLMQTGPAIRKDEVTIEKHEALLENNKHLLNLYRQMTDSIRSM
jgi:predicted short-subunit dehydrogenase-like oxidoreductase (DUF2520 family)